MRLNLLRHCTSNQAAWYEALDWDLSVVTLGLYG